MAIRELRYTELTILSLLAIGITVLGALGFSFLGHTPLDSLYLSIQLFVLESGAPRDGVPAALEIARWCAPLFVAYTAIRTLLLLSRNTTQMLKLHTFKGHVVICGLGQKGARLAEGFLQSQRRVVAIERNEQNEMISAFREQGAIVLTGDAGDTRLLRKVGVEKAGELFVVTADDNENVEIAVRAYDLVGKRQEALKGRVRCYVHIFKPYLRDLFKKHHVFTVTGDDFDARIFNIYERSARILLDKYPPDVSTTADKQVRILIAGFGWMGQSIALQAARTGHYRKGATIRIDIVDKADGVLDEFLESYPRLPDIVPVTAHGMDVTVSSQVQQLEGQTFSSVYICLGAEALSARAAQRFSTLFPSSSIMLCMLPRTGLATLLEGSGMLPRNVHAFNMIHEACHPEAVVGHSLDTLANRIHEYYRSGRVAANDGRLSSQYDVDWDFLPEEVKESNRNQADHIRIKLRAVGYDLCMTESGKSNGVPAKGRKFKKGPIEILAEMEHNRWKAERFLEGWRYGPEKNIDGKLHPDLVTWDKLPNSERDVNRRAVERIPDILEGWHIRSTDGKQPLYS
jgi:voltage-gated potassium channel Kch